MRALGRLVVERAARALRRAVEAKRQSSRLMFGVLLGGAVPLGLVVACGEDRANAPIVGGGNLAGASGLPEGCETPNEGCECPEEGAEADCGQVREEHGDYVTCSMGTRTCTDGSWSACVGERITLKSTRSLGLKTRGLGVPQDCGDLDLCDPYCNVTPDTPDGVDAGPNFTVDGGLTIVQTADAGPTPCETLTLTPDPATVDANNNNTVTVTSFDPLRTSPTSPVRFQVGFGPPSCTAMNPFPATWTIDAVDRADVTGTNNTNGRLTIAVPIAGEIQVTIYALGLSASTTVNVKVNVVEAPTDDTLADPNDAADLSAINAFSTVAGACAPTVTDACRNQPNLGSGSSSATWLYPYANTYLPLALQAPWIQYLYASSSSPNAVKVSLRYPTGLAPTDAATLFNYSLIVWEGNNVGQTYAAQPAIPLDPQVILPQEAWQYFEQTARGQNADIVVQRYTGSSVMEPENHRQIHFVDGQLKGTVYYSTYNTSLSGAGNTGAILKIAPGATTPTLAAQPQAKCTVCHTVNLDGTRVITNTGAGPTGNIFNESVRYDLTTAGPAPMVLNSYAGADEPVPTPGTTTDAVQYGMGPLITKTGTPSEDCVVRITITTGGDLGTAQFNWDFGGLVSTLTGSATTAATVALAGTGLTIAFPAGTYVAGTIYEFRGAASAGDYAREYYAHILGNRYTYGAPWVQGDFYMTHGGRATGSAGVGDPNFRAPPDYSNLFAVAPDTARLSPIPVTNWPSNMLAVTPRFSPDGTKLAFGYWGGSALPRSPASLGTLAQVSAGTRLTVVDFSLTCTTPPCASGSDPGLTVSVSNARDLTPGVKQRVAWPTFTPPGDAVVYQRQFRTAKSRTENPIPVRTGPTGPEVTITGRPNFPAPDFDDTGTIRIVTSGGRGAARFNWLYGGESGTDVTTAATVALGTTGMTANFPGSGATYTLNTQYTWSGSHQGTIGDPGWAQWTGWSPSAINTSAGALAELWISAIPANGSTAVVPTRLNALNGLSGDGMSSYLPTASRLAAPAQDTYHATNATFTITQADHCDNNGTARGVNDYQLNYLPAFNPTQIGGYNWIVFTSRRMFGNVAYSDPWDAKPGEDCHNDVPPTKKLWVAAIEPNVTAGTDPSHPAFYLPGQELLAGNADGYWVNTPCAELNAPCVSHDDCCLATGASPTRECKITSSENIPPVKQCQEINACSHVGAACTTAADCCLNEGLTCPDGGGVCLVPPAPPSSAFGSQTTSREYIAECPHGTQVKWRFFEWQATMPTGTSIVLAVQTKATDGDDYEPAMPRVHTTINVTTPANAWHRGPDTVDETLAVDPPLPSRNYLRVVMTFVPTPTQAPVLHQWRQIFDCVPSE